MMKKKQKKEDKNSTKINMQKFHTESFENNSFQSSLKSYIDYIMPSGIDTLQPSYINIDGAYIAVLLCVDFPYETTKKGFLDELINYGEGVKVSLYHKPEDKLKMIKEITSALGFTKHKMQTGGDNQVDSGTQENAAESSVYMKSKLSKGDEFFYINLFVRIIAETPEGLEEKVRKVESKLTNIFYQRADFRQLEAFRSSLPLNLMDERMKKQTNKNILASGLCSFYPFTSSSLSDPNGMYIGDNEYDKNAIILDIFDTEKYPNANMIICGKSGIGKTFLTQMIAGRFRMQKIPTMLICPLKGHEYKPLCDNVGGNFIKYAPGEKNRINVMEIRPTKQVGVEKASYLGDKLQRLKLLLSLLIPDITTRELRLLDAPLKRTYEKKGITMENASLYEEIGSGNLINLRPRLKEMPILEELQAEVYEVPELKRIAEEIEPLITGSLSFFNGQTNVDLENLYTVSDISEVPKELIAFTMYAVLDVYWERIKMDRTQKKAIILDELWKLIGSAGNAQVAESVLELFKIIRGYGGAAIGTTQDIQDFMMLEEGKYGKGIINASSIKIILGLEELDAATITDVLKLTEAERTKVEKFKRGQGLLYAAQNHLVANFRAAKTEERLINTDREKLLKYAEEGRS
ncbi:hypothetical protein Ami103574_10825 [Aminipila butyrica]|uniref:TraG P-loop domain-containing protein n=1 Tax=Aminipila butyrica TaxID=433296 RepID=A0A858BWI2_9FIRM|nr:hypothetical protein [Aminipila butyrica]QIB69782.1 hypothetical protein Ami103574_10825 [Aminipila butyrica]